MTGEPKVGDPEAAWCEVRELIEARRPGGLARRALSLTDAERAEIARRLPEFRKQARASLRPDFGDDDDLPWSGWERDRIGGLGEVLQIAGAATLPSPAAVTAWLGRREFTARWGAYDPAHVVRVLAARPVAFQADVATRLAVKIRAADDRLAPLALALLRACGAPPPEHDPLVAAWLAAGPVSPDPLLGPMLPRIFEAEGAGHELRDERCEPAPTPWLALFQRLLAAGVAVGGGPAVPPAGASRRGRVSRGELLDHCLRRFLRGGEAPDLRFFVRLHDMIDPSPEESAARRRDYLRLLPAAPGTVAALALAQVRRCGPYDDGEAAEAIEALTFRAETELARTGLRWLEDEVRHTPGKAPDLAPALATAFGHASYAIQGRAAQVAIKQATAFAPAAEVLCAAVPMLPAALGARVTAAFSSRTAA
ncbi:hypothetical protein [Nonomuraea maritima]|uniref:hypothetical protein n=1 Tax=Nonomuraea maritima TaxID=683260 RepID=UPI00371BAA96